jgi:hypothetical protein
MATATLVPVEMLERVHGYLEFGVPCVWLIDPRARRGQIYTPGSMREPEDGILGVEPIAVPLSEILPERNAE